MPMINVPPLALAKATKVSRDSLPNELLNSNKSVSPFFMNALIFLRTIDYVMHVSKLVETTIYSRGKLDVIMTYISKPGEQFVFLLYQADATIWL